MSVGVSVKVVMVGKRVAVGGTMVLVDEGVEVGGKFV